MNTTTENKPIQFTRVNNDVNGNPRYVCHFTALQTKDEWNGLMDIDEAYKTVLKRANRIGGRKFHNKQYRGGIVFQSYNIEDTERRILELLQTGK